MSAEECHCYTVGHSSEVENRENCPRHSNAAREEECSHDWKRQVREIQTDGHFCAKCRLFVPVQRKRQHRSNAVAGSPDWSGWEDCLSVHSAIRFYEHRDAPEPAQEVVLHRALTGGRGFIPDIDGLWEQCPGKEWHNTCDDHTYEHAVWYRRRE